MAAIEFPFLCRVEDSLKKKIWNAAVSFNSPRSIIKIKLETIDITTRLWGQV